MTLLLLEGFEVSRGTTQLSRKWATAVAVNDTVTGRQGVGTALVSGGLSLQSNVLGTANRVVFGCGWRMASGSSTKRQIRLLNDAATVQCTISFTIVDQHILIELRRGDESGTVVATLGRIFPNRWYYLEFDVTVHNSTGSIEFRVDGVSVHTSTGLNNANTGSPGVGRIHWVFPAGGPTVAIDDIYIDDSVFRGPITLTGIHPSANGAELDYIPSSGSNHAALLKVSPGGSGDTTFVTTNAVGQRELLEMDNLPSYIASNAPVVAVGLELTAQMAAAGNRDFSPRYRSSGGSAANDAQTVNFSLTSLTTKQVMLHNNPVTTNPWTVAEVNDGQFGLETMT